MKRIILLAFLFACIFACQKQEITPLEVETNTETDTETISTPDTTTQPISFSCAMVGQMSQYIRWEGENLFSDENTQTFNGDTLIQEIISEENGVYTIEEYFSSGSAILTDPDPSDAWLQPEEVFIFQMEVINDSIFFAPIGNSPPSRMLYWTFAVFPKQTATKDVFTEDGWKIIYEDNPYDTHQGKLPSLTLGNTTYQEVQVISDASATVVDGPGYLHAYNLEYGLLHSYIWSAWIGSAHGWSLHYEE